MNTALAASPIPTDRFLIPHPVLEQARLEIEDLLSSPRPPQMIAVVGGAGSGKSTLLDLAHAAALAEAAPAMIADARIVPVGRGEVPAPTSGRMSWHPLANEAAQAFRVPARGLAVPGSARAAGIGFVGRQARNATEALADAASDIRLREGRILFLDEGNHLAVMADQKRADVQFDVLKGFVADAGIRLVLFGTYNLLRLAHASAQLGRRTAIVHLRPYDLASTRDRRAFRMVAETLAREIGDEEPIDDTWLEELHEGSAGCVGLLVDWLLRAAHVHRRRGRGSVRATIRAKAWDPVFLEEVYDELATGATMLAAHPRRAARTEEATLPAPRRVRQAPVTRNGQRLKVGEPRPRRLPVPAVVA